MYPLRKKLDPIVTLERFRHQHLIISIHADLSLLVTLGFVHCSQTSLYVQSSWQTRMSTYLSLLIVYSLPFSYYRSLLSKKIIKTLQNNIETLEFMGQFHQHSGVKHKCDSVNFFDAIGHSSVPFSFTNKITLNYTTTNNQKIRLTSKPCAQKLCCHCMPERSM